MATQYIVERADLERDRDEVIELWKRNGVNKPDPARHFDWAYNNNPAGPGCLWLLTHTSDQRLIGSVGLIPRRLKINDSVVLVGRAGGLAVDKSHRSLGPMLMLQKTMLEECGEAGISWVYSLAPPNVSPVFKRLKFTSLGNLECCRKLIRSSRTVANYTPFLPRFMHTFLAEIVDMVCLTVTGNGWYRSGRKELTRVLEFDSRFDDLWHRAESGYSLTTERSSAFLRWRFSNHPRGYSFVCDALQANDGSLRGYVVYRISGGSAHILDLFAVDQQGTISTLVSALSRQLRSEGVSSLAFHVFGSPQFLKSLRRLGFWLNDHKPVEYILQLSLPATGGVQFDSGGTGWSFLMVDDFLNGPF